MKKVLVFAILVLTGSFISAQNLKIGYVDSKVILEQYPAAIKAQSDMDAVIATWNKTLDSMRTALQSEYATYQQQEAAMTPDKKKEAQAAIVKQEQGFQAYQQQKFGQQAGELYVIQDKFMAPIKAKVLDIIDVVRKEEGMHFVFDKVGESSVILFADPTFDITYKVLDKLKRGSK